MLRLGTVVLAMEIAAVTVAVLSFGYLVLLVGVPLIVATVCVLIVARLSDTVRTRRRERAEAERTVVFNPVRQAGLMSGFFTPAPRQADPSEQSDPLRR